MYPCQLFVASVLEHGVAVSGPPLPPEVTNVSLDSVQFVEGLCWNYLPFVRAVVIDDSLQLSDESQAISGIFEFTRRALNDSALTPESCRKTAKCA
jgi:hypothetical protein